MAWGDKAIARKFRTYASAYATWAEFTEISRPVPKTTAIRVYTPFFDEEVFLQGGRWCMAAKYSLDRPEWNTDPRPIAPLDAYEGTVAVVVAQEYLTSLAMQIGTDNEDLVFAPLQRLMVADDNHDDERRHGFMAVMGYLISIASGEVAHESQTRQIAREVLHKAMPTLREIEEQADITDFDLDSYDS